ncbi:MAG TPA: iron ABC transporter permease [Candidatus Polarisedimenticolia bacterium]|nr:iron ABC transporter permease [Candidatus Polarisedimenticolia bacterium]
MSNPSLTAAVPGRRTARGRRFTIVRAAAVLGLLAALLAATMIFSLTLGSTSVGLKDLLMPEGAAAESRTILLRVRLPRILLAAAVGASLSAAGVFFQALLRNPLADPYILGISGGAGLGAVLSSALAPAAGVAMVVMRPAAAFAGAIGAVLALLGLARLRGRLLPETMILLGVVMNATIMAAIMFIVTMADFSRYAGTMYWLIGNLSSPSAGELALVYACLVPGVAALALMGQPLNVMAGGEELAGHLGVNVARLRVAGLMVASLMTAAAVALSGLVGFVGLMVPHLGRVWLGPDNRLLAPASALLGAIVLVAADTAARSMFAPTQIPVGVITALFGGPCFLWLFARRGAGAVARP